MTGRINSFQSLGTVDGPGVRCVVFMQGCPLRCICCHNPETWDVNGGEEIASDALVKKILRFRSYFGKNGGVTVSGGEPLLQAEFVAELFRKLRAEGIHTALDTSGCMSGGAVSELLGVTDLVLLDHKYASDEEYRKNAGCGLDAVERFLSETEERGIPVWLRRVIIPGVNDSPADVKSLNETANRYKCVERAELLPFRDLCAEKYKALGIDFPLAHTPQPTSADMEKLNILIDKKS